MSGHGLDTIAKAIVKQAVFELLDNQCADRFLRMTRRSTVEVFVAWFARGK